MTIIVQKYGGTSLASIDRIFSVADIIAKTYNNVTKQIVVVVSAMAGDTNKLLDLARQTLSYSNDDLSNGNSNNISNNMLFKKEFDQIASTGEQVSMSLLAMVLGKLGIKNITCCAWQLPIITTDDFMAARIRTINAKKIFRAFAKQEVVIVTGFQGVTNNYEITTLGRGGSDTSAVAIAVAIKANECQIYTDVNGVYNADPNKLAIAKRIPVIEGVNMLEAASLGAKVLHVRSCELAYRNAINLRVLSTFFPLDQGTIVMNNYTYENNNNNNTVHDVNNSIETNETNENNTIKDMETYPIISLSLEDKQVLVAFSITTKLANVLTILYNNLNLDMLQIDNKLLKFVINSEFLNELNNTLTQLNEKSYISNVSISYNLSKISLIGSGFRSNNKLNAEVYQLINDIEVLIVTHNEISISILVHDVEALILRNQLSTLLIKQT